LSGHACSPGSGENIFLLNGQPHIPQTYVLRCGTSFLLGQPSQIDILISAICCCSGVGLAAAIQALAISTSLSSIIF